MSALGRLAGLLRNELNLRLRRVLFGHRPAPMLGRQARLISYKALQQETSSETGEAGCKNPDMQRSTNRQKGNIGKPLKPRVERDDHMPLKPNHQAAT